MTVSAPTYTEPRLSIAILDYNRPKEAATLMRSLRENACLRHDVVYVSNGGDQGYIADWFSQGIITRWVRNRTNDGCGLGTRLAFQSCMTQWVAYVQVDQWLARPWTEEELTRMLDYLAQNPSLLYLDLAGNQGHGRFSERALLINRDRYLSIPGMDRCIGGPGPYADHLWTEQLVQEHMAATGLTFRSTMPPLFGDNGKWSRRSYPCGAETLHSTDEKRLFILKPFKAPVRGFPNLTLNEAEWRMAIDGTWPSEGVIPEADRQHSFICWSNQ